MADEVLRMLLRGHDVRAVIAVTGELSREAAARHGAAPMAAAALSRAATASLLLATLTKEEERVTLQVSGGGPLGLITADARSNGEVRMTAREARAVLPAPATSRLSVAPAVGNRGVLQVTRDLGLKERYTGQAQLTTGEIDEDVEQYLRASEQLESALACEVLLAPDGGVRAAAGLLLQAMPGAPAAALLREAQHRMRTGEVARALAADPDVTDPTALALAALPGVDAAALELLDRRPARFHCGCSRERVSGMLRLLDRAELEKMVAAAEPLEIHCEFCRARYEVPLAELEKIARPN